MVVGTTSGNQCISNRVLENRIIKLVVTDNSFYLKVKGVIKGTIKNNLVTLAAWKDHCVATWI
jgi:hypothetical protein